MTTLTRPALLNSEQAKQHARALEKTGRVRADALAISQDRAVVEIRPWPRMPWFPTRTLRTAEEVENLLAELTPAPVVKATAVAEPRTDGRRVSRLYCRDCRAATNGTVRCGSCGQLRPVMEGGK